MFTLHDTVASPARIGLELIGIAPGAPLDLDLRVESVSEGVLVSGTLSAPTTGECARCLTPFSGRIEVALTELFAYPDSITEATTEEDEVGRVVDDIVDLEQPIIDAVGPGAAVLAGVPGRLPGAVSAMRCRCWRPPNPVITMTRSTRAGPSSPAMLRSRQRRSRR